LFEKVLPNIAIVSPPRNQPALMHAKERSASPSPSLSPLQWAVMGVLYKLTEWSLGEDLNDFVARTQAELENEKQRQATASEDDVLITDDEANWLRKTEELLSAVKEIIAISKGSRDKRKQE
jgi:hypothetical protein